MSCKTTSPNGAKENNDYKITLFLSPSTDKEVYLSNDQTGKIIDSDRLTNTKCILSGYIKETAEYTLSINGSRAFFPFILEKDADIKIEGNADSIWKAKVYGSKENNISDLFSDVTAPYIPRLNFWGYKRDTARQNGDSLKYYYYKKENQKVFDTIFMVYDSLIKAFPNSYTSLSTLYYYYALFNKNQRIELWRTLSSELKSNSLGVALHDKIIIDSLMINHSKAPNFTLRDTSGNEIKLAAFKGHYIILLFWASWCAPCRQENPELVNLYNEYNSNGVVFISVSLDNNKKAWEVAINHDHLPWIQASDLKEWGNVAAKQYGVTSIPAGFVINREGYLLYRFSNAKELGIVLAKLKPSS